MLKFSVIISIYEGNVPELLRSALDSLLSQTLLPEEIFIVADGPVPALLEEEVQRLKFKVQNLPQPLPEGKSVPEVTYLPLERHGGLGEAMRRAVEVVKGEFIARMDADDICLPDRFEKQMMCFEEEPTLSVVGGQIAEFDGDVKNITGRRVVPLEHEEIVSYMKSRNGMNHVTAIFKKADLLDSGNYQPLEWFEDYYLWVKMIQHGCKFKNISDDVVLVRAGKAQADRRGGWAYFKNEVFLFKCLLSQGFITKNRFCINIIERSFVRLLMTSSIRSWFYKNVLR